MFFKDKFRSLANNLDNDFNGLPRQIGSDRGELCEIFMRSLLYYLFNDQFKIFRGGKIVNIDNKESRQMDIVLSAKNTIKIFSDKGIYPIESVFGVFSITATLDHRKLFDERGIIEEFKSIPKENPKFDFIAEIGGLTERSRERIINRWNKLFPYKCVFGFTGDINVRWEKMLNSMTSVNNNVKNCLPDLIIVNKKGVITKLQERPTTLMSGRIIDKDFYYINFDQTDYGYAISRMSHELYNLSKWQDIFVPLYSAYFRKDYESVVSS